MTGRAWYGLLVLACGLATLVNGCASSSRMGVRSVTACAELQQAPRMPERPQTYAGASVCVGFE